MEKTLSILCPYCLSENISATANEGNCTYRCMDCGCDFTEDDIEHERHWHTISALLNGTSESDPLVFEKEYVVLPSDEEMSQGLSDLEKLNVDKVFQVEGEGTMWFHYENTEKDSWLDMSSLSTADLEYLAESIRKEME